MVFPWFSHGFPMVLSATLRHSTGGTRSPRATLHWLHCMARDPRGAAGRWQPSCWSPAHRCRRSTTNCLPFLVHEKFKTQQKFGENHGKHHWKWFSKNIYWRQICEKVRRKSALMVKHPSKMWQQLGKKTEKGFQNMMKNDLQKKNDLSWKNGVVRSQNRLLSVNDDSKTRNISDLLYKKWRFHQQKISTNPTQNLFFLLRRSYVSHVFPPPWRTSPQRAQRFLPPERSPRTPPARNPGWAWIPGVAATWHHGPS